jgi:uncharacterized protein (TIGR03067 family)
MKYAESDHRRPSRISRLVIAVGLVLLAPGTGLTLQSRTPVHNDAGRASSAAVTDAKSDLEKMEGEWRVVHCEFSGRNEVQPVGVDTISGAKWLRPNRRTAEYQLKLDPSKDPKWVDLSAERLGDQTLKGIYLLDGNTLTICYAYDTAFPRPTAFKTMRGVRDYMYVLERVKKE